jgi:hypothetical protein
MYNFGIFYILYLFVIWIIIRPFGIFFGHLVNYVVISYISPRFGTFFQEKSGNPAQYSAVNRRQK